MADRTLTTPIREALGMYAQEFGADGRHDAALAELRELEDFRLIVRGCIDGVIECLPGGLFARKDSYITRRIPNWTFPESRGGHRLTDTQRAALLKACGET